MSDITQIIDFYKQGMDRTSIAALVGVSVGEVETIIDIVDIDKQGTKGIPLLEIVQLKLKDLEDSQIGKLLDCTRQNVFNRLAPYRDEIKAFKGFKENKADVYHFIQSVLLKGLTLDKVKESGLKDIITSVAILDDKIAKLEGGSGSTKLELNLVQIIEGNAKIQSVPVAPVAPVAPLASSVTLEASNDAGSET